MGTFEKPAGVVRSKRTWLFVAGVLEAVLGFMPAMGAFTHAIDHAQPLLYLAVAAYYAVFIGFAAAWNLRWREERGVVRADARGLWLGERLMARREALRHGYVLERDGRVYVRLARWMRPIDIPVSDAAEGEALLAAMRLDPAHSVAQFPMTHGTWRGSLVRSALGLVFTFVFAIGIPLAIMISAHHLGAGLAVMFAALVERVNERVAAHRAAGGTDAPVFARAGRETDAWIRDVVSAADVNASYRSPAVPPGELWRIVEDAAAPATARAGAAVALRAALDEPGRVRLRAVADTCAAPRLRVALETVATGHGPLDDRGRSASPRGQAVIGALLDDR